MHVLLIEDQVAIRALLARAMMQSGWTVCQAGNLETARTCLIWQVPRVIVADRHLGRDEDGHLFASQASREAGVIPVVYMSACRKSLATRTLRRSDRALAKPFMPDELVATVRDIIHHTDAP